MRRLDQITLPFEDALRAERRRLIATLDALSDDDFDAGSTLCAEWAPRDVLGHVIGLDYFLASYLRHGVRINAANKAQADRARQVSRARLMEWARHWADRPSTTSRLGAAIMLGDLGMHHQDVLRGLGRARQVPGDVATAIFREGLQLSLWLNRRVLRHRLVPTDGHRPVGRGSEVRGTREALGLWLAGRDAVAGELEFA
ncbi:maleylpyruvate isomerase family mycothiol-dependent enzyme [Actinomadura parmotrematis]|uniref:Maleylpyruvate isomerase family mycothiol-dependent enzyme n=1 Tax=Actinomadura parmotrematis TaxID=2864039 RepID=A0ABS7FP45_9ACTN|nr:maleylpyruvate isomerase family mycothiol-dependent enzyme [Actinomadura parmotrematis]MBW8482165.1 maleylpyruvate isomerase family mycothiol-dependent enzyme [Actinomadura parmotrematis]